MEFVSLCPFCGFDPIEQRDPMGVGPYEIECFNLDCPVQPSVEGSSRNDAMSRWNARSVTAATEVLMRTLKPEDRISACGTFCRYCGEDGRGCQCWNDD